MKIPAIRDRLNEIGVMLQHRGLTDLGREIAHLAEATRRRPYLRKVGKHEKRDSEILAKPGMKRWIRLLRRQGNSYRAISAITGIYNNGRISEVCEGKRV